MSVNQLAFHCTVARHGTLALDVSIAKAVGFSALEMSGTKLQKYFDVGYTQADLGSCWVICRYRGCLLYTSPSPRD